MSESTVRDEQDIGLESFKNVLLSRHPAQNAVKTQKCTFSISTDEVDAVVTHLKKRQRAISAAWAELDLAVLC